MSSHKIQFQQHCARQSEDHVVRCLQGAEVPQIRPFSHLDAIAYRFNHRFELRSLIASIVGDVGKAKPLSKKDIRVGMLRHVSIQVKLCAAGLTSVRAH